MSTKKLNDAFVQAIADANAQLEDGAQLSNADHQVLLSEGGGLDSLGILLFATTLDSLLQVDYPKISVVDLLMAEENADKFETIGSLRNHLECAIKG